jgi:hypothetical protein
MPAGPNSLVLAALVASRPLAIILALGFVTLFVLVAVLVWTRFGQARPLSKCVILSLLAHVLLLIYAYSTHILYGPPGRWTGQIVHVRLRDAADDVEAAPAVAASPKPWNQAGKSNVPLLLSSSVNEKVPEQTPPAPPETSKQQTVAQNQSQKELAEPPPATSQPSPPPEQPRLTDLLPGGPGEKPVPIEPPPANPLRSQQTSSTELLRPEATTAPAPPPSDSQFVAATKVPAPRRLGDGQDIPEPLQARVRSDRLKAAQPFGATAHSEAAVAAALDWLARAQSNDGRWDADAHGAGRETRAILGHDRRVPSTNPAVRQTTGAQADTGISGLALLAFLGSGETHLAGKHRENVQHGLEFLLASQSRDGNLAGSAELYAAMYSHGMATLALSEAFALTGDDRLLPGLQRALQFTIHAQTAAGGWRYQANETIDHGDLSQFGWQLMALHSAELGGIPTPAVTRERMIGFLRNCSIGRARGLASYQPGHRASRTMTAEGLVCRYFLQAENSPAALNEGAAYVLEERPQQQNANYYYWYYATLAMFQRQGADWTRWSAALQAELLARQRWDAPHAGSYDPDDLWGGYGGRVYSTALATLSLEVYYRYLPLHGAKIDDSRLTDRPWQPAMPR